MKKITLLLIAAFIAVMAQAGVFDAQPTGKLQNLKGQNVVIEEAVVTPPEEIDQLVYNFHGLDTYTNKEKDVQVFVVFDNNDVYIQGLSVDYLPSGWVKGTIADGVATFPAAYMGAFDFWGDTYELYFDGAEFTVSDDMTVFTAPNGYTTTAEETVLDEYKNVTLTQVEPESATPATPTINDWVQDKYGHYVTMTIPVVDVDGNDLLPAFLGYQMFYQIDGEQFDYVFTQDNYIFLESEEMVTIPYNYTDSYDIDKAGKQVYMYGDNLEQWTAIGVKSIYTAGGETHASDIYWYDLISSSIETIGNAKEVSATYYDLQGRSVSDTASGVLIKRVTNSDGTTHTAKIVR